MRAEYDHKSNRVVAVENDNGTIQATQNPRVLGAETEWYAVEVEYPEGYDARFTGLLKPASVRYDYDSEQNKIILRYPDADFSADAIREQLRMMIKGSARQILNQTDWVVVRSVESGEPIPDEVRRNRDEIRAKVDEYERQLEATAEADLPDFTFTFNSDVPQEKYRTERSQKPVKGGDGREWVTDASSPDEKGAPIEPVDEIREPGTPVIDRSDEQYVQRNRTGMPNIPHQTGDVQ